MKKNKVSKEEKRMSTELHDVTGVVSWAKVFPFNKDLNEEFHGPGGGYTIDVVLEKEELDKLTVSRSQLKPRVSDDGIFVKFRRKHTHPSIEEFGGPPRVVDADGNEWEPTKLIGNGSTCKIFFDVFETKLGPGTRLRAVQVLNLVEYEGGDRSETKLPF